MGKNRVLFLCTGNSCRSQMAEGLVNQFLGDRWEAFSAGSDPAGTVHPLAVQAMAEIGIDIGENSSKPVSAFRNRSFDKVITVCDNAAESCPAWLGEGTTTHIGFEDPADATGTDEERLEIFRRVRDKIRNRILPHLQKWDAGRH